MKQRLNSSFHLQLYTCVNPILVQCHISVPPENVRKHLVFGRFQGVSKCDTGLKWGMYIYIYISLDYSRNRYLIPHSLYILPGWGGKLLLSVTK